MSGIRRWPERIGKRETPAHCPAVRSPTRRAGRGPAAGTDPCDGGLLDGDRGAVTVEAALALCALVAVTALAVAALAGASGHLRCLDAAREAARLTARGEEDRAREVAADIAPRGARIAVVVTGDQVQVDVSAAVVPGLPGLSLDARAVAVLEPAALLGVQGDSTAAPGPPDDPRPADDTRGGVLGGPSADGLAPGGHR